MGAVIAGMYATLGSAQAVRERWRQALDQGLIPEIKGPGSDHGDTEGLRHPLLQRARRIKDTIVVAFAIHRESVLDDEQLVKALDFLLPDCMIEDLPIKLCFAATDLDTGDAVDLCRGSLRKTVRASSSVPGVAPAVHLSGRRLVDGGVVAETPVGPASRMGRPVLAIDVSMSLPPAGKDDSALDTMMRTQLINSHLLLDYQLQAARWVIRPDVGSTLWSEWDRFDEMIDHGRHAMDHWFAGQDPETPVDRVEPDV